jgi:nucleotide-binding universal stress UspA family protein
MRILYATDGSEGALAAARFLTKLPFSSTDYIHILAVELENRSENAHRALTVTEKALEGFPGRVTAAPASGSSTSEVVQTILEAADYLVADIIVAGARGHSALARFFLGNVAEGLARHSHMPILLARPDILPLSKVVIGVDGSSDARHAACWATHSFPLPEQCALHLVRVVPKPVWELYPSSLVLGSYDQTIEQLTATARQAAREDMEVFSREVIGEVTSNDRKIDIATPVGDPAQELLHIADTEGAGLLVVGSRGLTGLQRAFLGSVSSEAVHHASCSVLVVPHKQKEEKQ